MLLIPIHSYSLLSEMRKYLECAAIESSSFSGMLSQWQLTASVFTLLSQQLQQHRLKISTDLVVSWTTARRRYGRHSVIIIADSWAISRDRLCGLEHPTSTFNTSWIGVAASFRSQQVNLQKNGLPPFNCLARNAARRPIEERRRECTITFRWSTADWQLVKQNSSSFKMSDWSIYRED